MQEALNAGIPEQLQPVLQDIFTRFHIRLTDEGELFLRCTARWRYGGLAKGIHSRILPQKRPINRCAWPAEIAAVLHRLADKPLSVSENWLGAYCRSPGTEIAPSAINADDDEALVNYILRFINTHYNYNLLNDAQLHADLLTHIKTMITRVRYQIMIPIRCWITSSSTTRWRGT
jgi:hypothetical protein